MLFFKKKSEKSVKHVCCCKSGKKTEVKDPEGSVINSVKVLGAGCKSCHRQYENVRKAVDDMGLSVEVEYITDMEKVMSYGVMSMPCIVVNEKVASSGKVLTCEEVCKLLGKYYPAASE